MEERKWEELTFDCLVCIFSKLGIEDMTIGVPLVCKTWHGASLDPECWKILDFRRMDFTTNSKFIARFNEEYKIPKFSIASFMKLSISKSHGSVIDLTIPSMAGRPFYQDLIFSSIECPRLKVLGLSTLLIEDGVQISGLIARWKDLEILKLIRKPNLFLELLEKIRANCPKFMGLHLCGHFEEKDAEAIVKCLPKLRRLVMRGSSIRREELMMILNGCKELQEVDVSRCRGFDANDEILKKASSRIKKFACEGSKAEEYDDYAKFFLTYKFSNYW